MAIINLTREDILQTKLVEEAAWQRCIVDKATVEPAKKDQSTNYVFYCKINSGKEAGVPVRCTFSEKFLGPIKGFMESCGADVGEDGGKFNNEAFVGKELMIFVEAKENQNDKKIYNTPMQYMSIAAYDAMLAAQ